MVFKDYNEITEIFSGKSIVYRGKRVTDKYPVVIKYVPFLFDNSKHIDQLNLEYEILSSLNNDGILNVLTIDKTDSGLYMIMDDTNSISIREYLNRGNLSLEVFFDIALKVLEVLTYIHDKKVVHKDIHPENIIIDPINLKVHLIDFGISSLITNEYVEAVIPDLLEGHLHYVSPEQTGRMNKSLDYRSDFYSLGLTFYEFLTGTLPYNSSDPMELIHSHIARELIFSENEFDFIPDNLKNIIIRMVQKDKKNRYQSALGIKDDILKCQNQFLLGENNPFELGSMDISPYFVISEKLFGRENEIEIINNSLSRCLLGTEEKLYITGSSGTGKTSLVNEIRHEVSKNRGYFAKGKYGQLQKDISFIGISECLTALVKNVLCERKEIIEGLREKLLTSLGENISLMTTLIPDLELLVGKHESLGELKGKEASNRFIITMYNFLQVFATKEHPLVLVLDDLQWADNASLDLLYEIAKLKPINYFFFIGVYRDDEVSKDHPYLQSRIDLNENMRSSIICLKEISKNAVNDLLVETFNLEQNHIIELSNIIFEKTLGNPFYIKELLKSLYLKDLISFSADKKNWEFNIEEIKKENISSNVILFLIDIMSKLSTDCQRLLEVASCIGTTFYDSDILTFIPQKNIGSLLKEVVELELIIPTNNKYRTTFLLNDKTSTSGASFRFVHDKIQQAAYSLATNKNKDSIHLHYGRYLKNKYIKSRDRELLTSFLFHINKVTSYINNSSEKKEFAKLNLEAGLIAYRSTAYSEAEIYFKNGLSFISYSNWTDDYELFRDLTIGYSESSFLSGDNKTANEMIQIALTEANNNRDILKITGIRVEQCVSIGKLEKAIDIGLAGLAETGLKVSPNPSIGKILLELVKTNINRAGRSIEDLENSPELTDEEALERSSLALSIVLAAYLQGRENLFTFLVFRIVNIALKKGNCPISNYGYATFGILLCSGLGNYKTGWEYGVLSTKLMNKYPSSQMDGRIQHAFTDFIYPWKKHWKGMTEQLKRGVSRSYNSGDMVYASYMAQHMYIWNPTINVKELLYLHGKNVVYIKSTGYRDSLNEGLVNYNFYNNLHNGTNEFYTLDTDSFNEKECISELTTTGYNTGLAVLYLRKAELFCIYGEYEKAMEFLCLAAPIMSSVLGLPYNVRFAVVSIITYNRLLSVLNKKDKKQGLKTIHTEYKKIVKWTKYNPDSFKHIEQFLRTDINRYIHKKKILIKDYISGLSLASKNNWILDEAIFSNLIGDYFIELDEPISAAGYIERSYYLFSRHSCLRVTKFIESKYSEVLNITFKNKINNNLTLKNTTNTSGFTGELDFFSLIKCSAVISEEIILEPLIKKIMKIVIENAGAVNGVFVKKGENGLQILAETTINKTAVYTDHELPITNNNFVSERLINYVVRSESQVIYNKGDLLESYMDEEFLIRKKIKSLLCLPLVRNKQLYGVLYLDNNLTSGVFSQDRIDILRMLLSQIMISLENAQLYRSMENYNFTLEEEVKKRTNELKMLAMTDPLTKLMNRRAMIEKMEHELVRFNRNKKSFILILCDIDNFKKFNDSYGHDCGDLVLQRVSKVFLTNIREQDQVSRWGGEEFLIMLPDTDQDGGILLAEKLRVAISSNKINFDTKDLRISMTFGGASISNSCDIDKTIKEADKRLYKGKSSGKNCVIFS